jgi:hypothetical protein
MRDDTCPELKRSRKSLLRAWDALQKLRKIIEVFALEPMRRGQLDPSVVIDGSGSRRFKQELSTYLRRRVTGPKDQ